MLLAAVSAGWAVAAGSTAAALAALATLYKVRPEHDALIAQAAESATNAVNIALAQVRRELEDSRAEVDRLRTELGAMADRERELLTKIAELEGRLKAQTSG